MNNQLFYAYSATFTVLGSVLRVILSDESNLASLLCLLFWFSTGLFAFLFHSTYKKLKKKMDS